ncbi:hypothetical protein EYR36_000112 [Pleurotus pulmonarius]|nr:hypothetical protein EYR36_000112 [Pleurotus pulmonarius]
MTVLSALRIAHAAKPFKAPVAVVVGGTAGIGAALAEKIARYSVNPEIHLVGRSKVSAEKVLSGLKHANPGGQYHFHQCDVSLLANARTLATSLSQSLPKVNLLVLTPGMFSISGRTETAEGHDVKMVLHYYTRMLFAQRLLSNLQAAADAGENARVSTVLDSKHGDLRKLDWDDLDLKKGFGIGAVTYHIITMTDIAIQRFARLYPSVSFQHAFPSIVATSISRAFPWYVTGPAAIFNMLFAKSAEDCAEYLFDPLWNDSMKTGAHFIDSDGKEVAKVKADSGKDAQEKLWRHTEDIIGKP